MFTSTMTAMCCLLLAGVLPATAQPPQSLAKLKKVLSRASENGLTAEQAAALSDKCLAVLRESTGDIDQQIAAIETLGKVYHLAPIGVAEPIRRQAVERLEHHAALGVPALDQLTWFIPRRFADTEEERMAQFHAFDQLVANVAGEKTDENTLAMKLNLQAHVRMAASREPSGFTSSERRSTQEILRELAARFGSLEGPAGLSYSEYISAAIFELQNLAVGKMVPNIRTVDFDGNAFDLADLRGKVVVLNFWATWCPPCMAEIPFERELVNRYRDQPFVFVGINGDFDESKAKAFVREKDIPWINIPNGPWPTDECISKRWNVMDWPTYYVIDARGRIAFRSIKTHECAAEARARLLAAIDDLLADG